MAVRIPRSNLKFYFIFLLILLVLILGITSIVGNSKEKNEKLYSDESKYGDWVYVDIISIEPTVATTKRENRDMESYEGFFCSCETVDGKTISTYIDSYEWDKYIDKPKYSSRNMMPKKIEFDDPLRIHCIVSKRKSILSYSADESLVLDIRKSDRPTY